ncbi:MAG: (2,3-dihydroxybenzoyl)adenylate synthase, partial [Dechloromonas sp.]
MSASQTLGGLLRQSAKTHADSAFIGGKTAQRSFAQFDRDVDGIATGLLE